MALYVINKELKLIITLHKRAWLVLFVYIFNPVPIYALNPEPEQIKRIELIQLEWGSEKKQIGTGPRDYTPGPSVNPIAVDNNGNIAIGDSINYRILKFDSKGNFITAVEHDMGPVDIADIVFDKDNNMYAAFNPGGKVAKYEANDKLISVFDISTAGVLDKDNSGVIKLDKEERFFTIYRIRVSNEGIIYVLGSNENILKLNKSGAIVQRWGPYATHAMRFLFVDNNDDLYIWMPPEMNGSMYKRYDKKGKFIGPGLGIYADKVEPFYKDRHGNIFGFKHVLVMYNLNTKQLIKFPLKYEDVVFEWWTVDPQGNVYYTDTGRGDFRVIKMSVK